MYLGKLVQTIGWLLLILRGFIPDIVSIGVANTLIILGFGAEMFSISSYNRKDLKYRAKIFGFIAAIFVLTFLILTNFNANVRIAFMSFVFFIWLIIAAQQLIVFNKKNKLQLASGIIFIFFSIFSLARTISVPIFFKTDTLFDPNIIQSITYTVLFLFNFVSTLLLLLLLKGQDESLIKLSEEKHRNFTEFLPQIVFEINTAGKFIYLNKQANVLSGYSAKDIENGLNIKDVFVKEDLERVIENIKTITSETRKIGSEYTLQKKDGEKFPVLIYSSPIIEDDKLVGIRGIIVDITERKKTEQQLKKLSIAVEQSANTIVLTDTDGKIEYTNPKFSQVTGYTAEEAIGQNPSILNAGVQPKEYYVEMWQTIADGHIWKGEFCNKKKNGLLYWEQVTITPVKNDFGQIVNYLAIKEDITAKREAEQALKKQNEEYASLNRELSKSKEKIEESNNTKDMFFSILAHDLRSPFNTILGFSDLLINNFDEYEVEEQKNYLNIINQGIHSTYKLLENLLLWSQTQRGTIDFYPENENLYLLTSETFSLLNPLAKNKSIKLVNKIPKDMDVWVDKNMLLTILRNLVSNGIKFTQNGGSVEIGCKTSNVKTSHGEPLPEIYVKDTGLGISKKKQTQLFKIAENISTRGTEGETGTGLGIILCKEFIEKYEGKIWVVSETGKGSEFIFTLWNN